MIITIGENGRHIGQVTEYLKFCRASFMHFSITDLILGNVDMEIGIWGDPTIQGVDLRKEIGAVWIWKTGVPNEREAIGRDTVVFRAELLAMMGYLYNLLGDRCWLPEYQSLYLDRLTMLEKAHGLGITVPRSKLIYRRDSLNDFLVKCGGRAVNGPVRVDIFGNDPFGMNQNPMIAVNRDDLRDIPATFPLTLFQEYIRADLHLKIFYLDGRFFTLCSLPGTEPIRDPFGTDFDKMEYGGENTCYLLPLAVTESLGKLLRELGLTICTLDISVRDGDHFLRDIDPIGHFSREMADRVGYIEKTVADWVRSKDHEWKKNNRRIKRNRKTDPR